MPKVKAVKQNTKIADQPSFKPSVYISEKELKEAEDMNIGDVVDMTGTITGQSIRKDKKGKQTNITIEVETVYRKKKKSKKNKIYKAE